MKTVYLCQVFDRNSGKVYVRKDKPYAISAEPEISIILQERTFQTHQIVMNADEAFILLRVLQEAIEAKEGKK